MAVVLPNGRNYFATVTGAPGVGYRLYTYVPGTSTPKATYTTSGASVANANPVVADSRGEMTVYWVGDYDVILKDASDVTIWGPARLEESATDAALDALIADLANTADPAKGDALVGVKRTAAGATAVTLHALFERTAVNAADFGAAAAASAATNQTSIQAALDYVASLGGGVVLLGPGTFQKSAALTMPQYVTLKGAGMRSTYLENTTANVNGINMGAGYRHGGIEDLSLTHKTGDTTNIGINFDGTNGYAHGRFRNVLITGFNRGVSAGDELWESEFNNVRCDTPLSRGFLFSGSTGSSSDNLMIKCYVNNVGNGAATGKSFEFSAAMSKSAMLNCTFGDTSSTENQVEIGTNVKGLEIVGGNCEGFTLATGNAAVNVGSASVVSVRGLVFQSVNGPGAGSAALFKAADSATINVSGCAELGTPTGTLYSMRVGGSSTARILHSGNSFVSGIDTTIPSGPQITQLAGKQIAYTSSAIDLSGAAATRLLVYVPSLYGYLVSATLIYTEATSADAGVLVQVGYVGDTDFLASVTSGTSKAIWDATAMTIHDRRIGAFTGPIIVTCSGGKVGTGEVVVMLEFTTIS